MTEPSVNDMMAAYALDAVDYAQKTFGIRLGFSSESVRDVETVASRLYEARPKGVLNNLRKEPSPEIVRRFSIMLGGYVGEVYRKAKGGEWFLHEEMQAYAVGTPQHCVFPVAKAFKRLTNGQEDNLWHFFQVVDRPQGRELATVGKDVATLLHWSGRKREADDERERQAAGHDDFEPQVQSGSQRCKEAR